MLSDGDTTASSQISIPQILPPPTTGLEQTAAPQVVDFYPPEIARRHLMVWNGMHADTVQVIRHEPFEFSYRGPHHLLIAAERVERLNGETSLEGLPKSAARTLNRKMTFVPAGRELQGWQTPRTLARITCFYINPLAPLLDPQLGFSKVEFKPQLHFFDQDLWETAMKLRAQVESSESGRRPYAEALSLVLLHELLRVNNGSAAPEPVVYGGLATWQQKRVADYIEEHLSEEISLSTLASLVNLSPYHFSRAFRQSFAMPPHRYHISRRIDRAKCMLTNVALSVTEIGQKLGFSESSAFASTFRKFTKTTPSEFRRSLR
jgi:AraC family transcriptional regulator